MLWRGGGALGSDAGKRGGGRPAALCHPGQGGHGPGAGVLHRGAEKQHPAQSGEYGPHPGGAGTAGGAAGQPLRPDRGAERPPVRDRRAAGAGPEREGGERCRRPGGPALGGDSGPGAGGAAGEGVGQDGRRPSGQGPAVRPGRRRPGGAGPGRGSAPGAQPAGPAAGGGGGGVLRRGEDAAGGPG